MHEETPLKSNLEENKAKVSESEDTESLCKVCGLAEPPFSKAYTPKKIKRTRKPSSKAASKIKLETWIKCSVCCNWYHIGCVGITKAEKSKLKGKAFYKCIVCCFDIAKLFKCSLESALNIHFESKESSTKVTLLEPESTPEQYSSVSRILKSEPAVQETKDSEQFQIPTPLSVVSFTDSCLKSESDRAEIAVKSKDLETESLELQRQSEYQNIIKSLEEVFKEESSAISTKDKCKTKKGSKKACETDSSKAKKKRELNKVEDTNLGPESNKFQEPEREEIFLSVELDKNEERSAREKIVIIGKVSNPENFKNSQVILKELNRYCPDIKAIAAFSLARGGISIYLKSVEDRDEVLKKLTRESFGGGIKKILSPFKSSHIFLKGVDTSIREETIITTLKSISSGIQEVKRLRNNQTGKLRQVIKVTCSQEAAGKLTNLNLLIGERKIRIEKQRG